MSERKPDIDMRTDTTQPLHNLNPTPQERAEYRARMVQVGTRGVVSERVNVELPPELHGEWVNNTDVIKIHEYEQMGFRIDTEYAVKNKLHSNGTGQPIIGDTVFMTIPRWMKQELELKQRIAMERNNPSRNSENQDLQAGLGNDGVPVLTHNGQMLQGSAQTVEGVDNIQALLNNSE